MKVQITMTVETTNDNFEDDVIDEEDMVEDFVSEKIDGEEGLVITKIYSREVHE